MPCARSACIAQTPTDFVLELENGQQGGADPRARRLLNTEKLILSREVWAAPELALSRSSCSSLAQTVQREAEHTDTVAHADAHWTGPCQECEGGACRVRVRADYAGVSLDPGLKDRAVLYNIGVFAMGDTRLCCCPATLPALLWWWAEPLIYSILQWWSLWWLGCLAMQ